jgi:hypothetical protein
LIFWLGKATVNVVDAFNAYVWYGYLCHCPAP